MKSAKPKSGDPTMFGLGLQEIMIVVVIGTLGIGGLVNAGQKKYLIMILISLETKGRMSPCSNPTSV